MSLPAAPLRIASIEHLQQVITTADQVIPCGGGSKPALAPPSGGAQALDLRGLAGILEYDPGEYTFTALAGTTLATVDAALAEHGQYLPFDPPLVAAGATLGGTVAAGLSGSGRYRYGGVRDFLIGVHFVDGKGRLVRGGGKVVKNAAGFDLPKLMVGSLGRFGVLAELTFKVFPRLQHYASASITFFTLEAALAALQTVAAARLDLEALDLVVEGAAGEPPAYTLWVRLGGWEALLPQRLEQIYQLLGIGIAVTGAEEAAAWHAVRECTWAPADHALVKVATTPAQLPALEAQLVTTPARRRYAVGGNLTWLSWPGALSDLDRRLAALNLSGLLLRGQHTTPYLGQPPDATLIGRVKQTLDPLGKLGAV
jgi:glycolate oxidase FAD binding subunit